MQPDRNAKRCSNINVDCIDRTARPTIQQEKAFFYIRCKQETREREKKSQWVIEEENKLWKKKK